VFESVRTMQRAWNGEPLLPRREPIGPIAELTRRALLPAAPSFIATRRADSLHV
jgi:hypothetical protein